MMNKNSADATQQRRERWTLVACISSLFGLLPLFYLWGALAQRAGDHVMFIVLYTGPILIVLAGFMVRAIRGFDSPEEPMLPCGIGRTTAIVIMSSMIIIGAVCLVALWRLGG